MPQKTQQGKPSRAAYFRDYRARKKAAKRGADFFGAPPPAASGKQRARALCEWAQAKLIVPDGPGAGQPFKLADWQRCFFAGALDPLTREAGLSIARRNGKTYSVAVLCLGYLVGPLAAKNLRAAAVSLTAPKSTILRDAIMGIAEASAPDAFGLELRRTPYPGSITAPSGASVLFLSADKAGAHGLGLNAGIIDELGLFEENDRPLVASVRSSLGGLDGQLIAMSVRGHSPLFDEMRNRRDRPDVFWLEYCAPPQCALDDRSAWKAANPGLGGTKSMAYMERMARNAMDLPSEEADFRAFDLNQPQDPTRESIVSVADWAQCVADGAEATGPCYAAFDLGGSVSMGAFAAYWPLTGRLQVQCGLPNSPGLDRRGTADGVGNRYLLMERQGSLKTYAGRVLPVAAFLADGAAMIEGHHIRAMGCDRYRQAEAEQAILDAGLPWRLTFRGTGASKWAHGSADVRAFQRAVLRREIKAPPNLALESSIAESEIRTDAAGNPALHKARQKGRIDALQAAVIALGLAEADRRYWAPPEGEVQGFVKIA